MSSTLKKKLIGNTIKVTWVSSGITPSAISLSIFNGSDTLVNSLSMTSSGNGHYYGLYTLVNTLGYYVAQTDATVASKPYKKRFAFKAISKETD